MTARARLSFFAHRREEDPNTSAAPIIQAGIAPTLSLGFVPAFTEDGGLRAIATSAQFADSDSPNLGGGSLVVTLAGVLATDRLALVTTGPDIALNGNSVTYQGATIGTLSGGGFGAGSLTVAFTAGATPTAVQALIRAVGYENIAQNAPINRLLPFSFHVTDDTASSVQTDLNATLIGTDDAPVIANLAGDVAAATGGGSAVRLDQGTAAVVTDVDNTNFNMGTLTVRLTENRAAGEDLFGVVAGSGVSLAAGIVNVNGTNIGTVDTFGVGQDMSFHFNSGATPALVTQLIGAITYTNTNGFNPSTLVREVTFTLKDGGFTFMGGTDTAMAATHVNVSAPSGPPPPPPPPSGVPEGPRVLTIASARPDDSVISGDGLRVYTASQDGFVRIYSAETGALIQTVQVGTNPTALDVSLDGRYLFITEGQFGASPPAATANLYRLDLQTGIATTFTYQGHGLELNFTDVACLSNGRVLLTQRTNSSDPGTAKLFDPATGNFSDLNVPAPGPLERSASGDRVVIGGDSAMNGSLYDVAQGVLYHDTASLFGPNRSMTYSREAGLVAINTSGGGVFIYDETLEVVTQLTQYNPQFSGLVGSAFDETGSFLFVLDMNGDQIIQLAVADWSIVHAIPLEFDPGFFLDADLLVGPDNRYFTFLGPNGHGLTRINNPFVSDAVEGTLNADNLTGTDANDFLIGDTGADTMTGGAGNDIYYVDQNGDVVVEAIGGGSDTVRASASYILGAGAEVERLEAASRYGTQALDLTGNAFAQTLVGNAGDNILNGGGGADTLIGRAGNDWYFVDNAGDAVVEAAGQGNDRVFASVSYTLTAGAEVELLTTDFQAGTAAINLTGNELANTIFGNAGDNILNGGAGADILLGLAGNDWYFIDNAGDAVFDGIGQGNDRVFAGVSYMLTPGAEVEVMSTDFQAGTAAINLTGNEQANTIFGNAGDNVLNGNAGADILLGLAGNDWYFIDNAGDAVFEAAGQGTDRVFASVSYMLTPGAEVEILSTDFNAGTAAINLSGNEQANTIFGNDGDNVLNGNAGADTLVGRLGNDWFFVDNAGDQVLENAGEGTDRVFAGVSYTLAAGASVEVMSTDFNGGTSAINLTGNELANTIYGNDGVNILDGKGGADVLIGRAGADTFAFTTALGAGNIDQVLDFQAGVDKIALDHNVFAGLGLGALDPNAFFAGTAAHDADDRIIYDATTGQLFYDADGIGVVAAIQFASLATGLALTAGDFTVI